MTSSEELRKTDNLSLWKKIVFSFIACSLGLSLVEGSAWLWLKFNGTGVVVNNKKETGWIGFLNNDIGESDASSRLYLYDEALFWRLRPDTGISVENTVYKTKNSPVRWNITINKSGFRGQPFPEPGAGKKPEIICLGDSCTFGFRVNDSETYPAQLQRILNGRGLPAATVLNYGVPGYTSFQGLRLLRKILQQRRPDYIILAFGANDLEREILSDAEKSRQVGSIKYRLRVVLERLSITRVISGMLPNRRTIQSEPSSGTARVSSLEFRDNLQGMIDLSQQAGVKVVLLNLAFMGEQYADTASELARERKIPWIDGRSVLMQGLDDLLAGKRYVEEKRELDRFWNERVEKYHEVYYSDEFYRTYIESPNGYNLLKYIMIEPVHPNRIGQRMLAEKIASRIF